MRIFRRIMARFPPPPAPEEPRPAGSNPAPDEISRTTGDGRAPRPHPGAEYDNRGRARIGGYEIPDIRISRAETVEQEGSQAAAPGEKAGAGLADPGSDVRKILAEISEHGRGLEAAPDNLFRDLMLELPAAINARLEKENVPGGLRGLSADNRDPVIAIALAQHLPTRRLSVQGLLTIFMSLSIRGTVLDPPAQEGSGAARMTYAWQATLRNVGQKHPYQGMTFDDISRDLGAKFRREVKEQRPKGKFGPVPLEPEERNALTAIMLARLDATKDLCLVDLLTLYHEFRHWE